MIRRDVFQAIADPTRRKILILSASKARTPNELAEHFNKSRQAISKHIKILTECKLLKQEYSGREIYYNLNPKKIKEIDNWLEPFRLLWEERFNELDKLLNTNKNKKKE
jgi:DNA-binding transcriptional ArsR family regulator